ncbi:6276_t:CDS:2 [Acaulospora colombiana]|uniref:6276_t:CDS:1 n=1 Tax=Acaulospora colombiana TaxID=27376 RepID=A0ACA9L6F0_9GLOM|nr:6276_t:CDS:2 [Acaulospora colombiana]
MPTTRSLAFIRHWLFALIIVGSVINTWSTLLNLDLILVGICLLSTVVYFSLLVVDLRRRGGIKSWLIVEMAFAFVKALVQSAFSVNIPGTEAWTGIYDLGGFKDPTCSICELIRYRVPILLSLCGALITVQLTLICCITCGARNRGVRSIWLAPTSDLFYDEEEDRKSLTPKPNIHNASRNGNGNGQGLGVASPPSVTTAVSSSVTVAGNNSQNTLTQGYLLPPSTTQGPYPRRPHA